FFILFLYHSWRFLANARNDNHCSWRFLTYAQNDNHCSWRFLAHARNGNQCSWRFLAYARNDKQAYSSTFPPAASTAALAPLEMRIVLPFTVTALLILPAA